MLSFTPARGRKLLQDVTKPSSVCYHSPPQGDGNTPCMCIRSHPPYRLSFTPARGRKQFPTKPSQRLAFVKVIIHPRKGTETPSSMVSFRMSNSYHSPPQGDGNCSRFQILLDIGYLLSFTPARGRKPENSLAYTQPRPGYHSPPQGDGNAP